MADYEHHVSISTDANTGATVWVSDGDYYYSSLRYDVGYHYGPYRQHEPLTVDRFDWGARAPFEGHGPCEAEILEGKEETEMVDRQTFLDALVIEGRQVTAEELEVVREASESKWKLLVATLLARTFESGDLVLLKEKPKEVVVLKEEA